jgi:hypothetical protein
VKVWPTLFGSGWVWGLLVALALLSVVVSLVGFLLLILRPPKDTPDSADHLWGRCEAGDITREEFERLRRQAETVRRV